ncbi:protein FAM110D [Protobothrops mucrosquamatus]|uniref:protein FAM110D n=1 Tax=Protobothrops mucrosquamatus TaxID=103944 RepID=UPI000775BD9D|nr:protein FAM110D [Protobothrops mucrosquamatus]
MRPLSPGDGLSPLGLLTRGPDYLRKQLEMSGGGRTPSAVERLEADKAKYVKSRQVINRRQEPILLSHTPQSSPCCRRPLTLHQQSECLQGLTADHDGLRPKKQPPSPQSPIARRGGSRRLLRPDSLVIYRQKRDCSLVNKENSKGYSLMRWLFQSPLRDGHHNCPSKSLFGDGHLEVTQEENSMIWVLAEKEDTRTAHSVDLLDGFMGCESEPSQKTQASSQLNVDQPFPSSGHYQTEAKKELTLSYSLPLSEKERFFNYCGLDRNLVEVLGVERFKPGSWEAGSFCIGSASSEHDGLSYSGEPLSTEDPSDKLSSTVSVVERNARVIKWLYSCQQAQMRSKESTV